VIKDEVRCKVKYNGNNMPYGIDKVVVGSGRRQLVLETAGVMDLENFILEVAITRGRGCDNPPNEIIFRWK